MQKTQLALVVENAVNAEVKSSEITLESALNSIIELVEGYDKTFVMAAISQKGGVGKSTIVFQFAVMLANLGFKVRLVDCDVQQTLQHQRKKRNGYKKQLFAEIEQAKKDVEENSDLKDYFKEVRFKALEKRKARVSAISTLDFAHYDSGVDFEEIIETSQTFDIVIFDTPCHLSQMQANLMYVCDSIVMPFNNSDDEFDTNFRVNEFIKTEKVNAVEDGKVIKADIRSLIIDRPSTTADRNEYVSSLWEDSGFNKTHKLLDARLMNRQIYRDVKSFGLGVAEVEKNQASDVALKEIALVLKEILLSSNAKKAKMNGAA